MKYSILILALALGCCSQFMAPEPKLFITFDEVSQPYLDEYGQPEDITEFYSEGYDSVNWWWWSKGFNVNFVNSIYDDIYGWTVDSTYSFSPI